MLRRNNNIPFSKRGLTIIELTMVLMISSILIGIIYSVEKSIEAAKDETKKCIKRKNNENFKEITNFNILNNRPSKFYIENGGFKGEIFENTIFDKILSNKEITKIENYLYNKYMR